MDQFEASKRLETTGASICALVADLTNDHARVKPAPEQWSILEVINHLGDEEREDFRTRVDVTLHEPETLPPPIDPQGWVTARGYNTRDLGESVERFRREREHSLAWLRGLRQPDWERTPNHPNLRDVHAGDLMAAWVAHDLLHLRQLVELRWHLVGVEAAPYGVGYAGEW